MIIGSVAERKASLTSSSLKVYHPEGNSQQGEQMGRAFLKIPMMYAFSEVETIREGFLKRNYVGVLTIKSTHNNAGVQLLFDKVCNNGQFDDWKRCVEEAKYMNKVYINRLMQAKLTINSTTRQTQQRFSDASKKGKIIYFHI